MFETSFLKDHCVLRKYSVETILERTALSEPAYTTVAADSCFQVCFVTGRTI